MTQCCMSWTKLISKELKKKCWCSSEFKTLQSHLWRVCTPTRHSQTVDKWRKLRPLISNQGWSSNKDHSKKCVYKWEQNKIFSWNDNTFGQRKKINFSIRASSQLWNMVVAVSLSLFSCIWANTTHCHWCFYQIPDHPSIHHLLTTA